MHHSSLTLKLWLALLNNKALTLKLAHLLLKHFGSIELIFSASLSALMQAGLSDIEAAMLKKPNWRQVDKQLNSITNTNTQCLVWTDAYYPCLLREIANPPLILFVQGNVALLQKPQLAMVGARTPTQEGLKTAQLFSGALGIAGFTITSGLALGIDGASHRGALEFQAKTIAVLGSGLDTLYPNQHRALASQILAQDGAIISEFLPGTPPKAHHFPQRNRLISGLSWGVLIVEAAAKSGSLITARYALEQGKEIFAIPGSIYNPLSKGCHQLLKQGAKLVENPSDIIEEWPASNPHLEPLTPLETEKDPFKLNEKPVKMQPETQQSTQPLLNKDPEDQALLDCLGSHPVPIDLIIQKTSLAADRVSSRLVMLELQGVISSVAGGYVRSI